MERIASLNKYHMLKQLPHFMIFAHPRSGSSQLHKIFVANGLSLIYEPFNPTLEVGKYHPILMEKGIKETLRLMQQEALGFKHIWEQVGCPDNLFLLSRVPAIILWRMDTLNMAISYCVANKTKIWYGAGVEYSEKIKLNPELVSNYIQYIAFYLELYKLKAVGSFHLTYEQMFGPDGLDHVAAALHFVGGDIKDLEETRRLLRPELKQNQKPWSEVIENWDEVIAHLGTKNIPLTQKIKGATAPSGLRRERF